jgi:RND family efflux transporter MFP subunit
MNNTLAALMRHRATPWILATTLGSTSIVLAVQAQAQGSAPPPGKDGATAAAAAKPALSVQAVSPQSTPLTLNLAANGSVAAWQEASVGSETNGWRLAEVRVNVGERVQRGQVLATFANEMAQAELAQSKAAVAEAEATLADAAANAQRARDLQASGALSAERINALLTAERTAQARLEAQRAQLRVMQIRLTQTQLLAPDSGVISARNATVGAVVPAGQELFRLIRGGRLEWRAEVAATELGRVQPGQAVTVTPAGGTPVAGRVRMVAPTVDAATRNGLVYVDLPQPGAAKAGMFARGEFAVGQGQGLTLPQAAVVLRDGFSYVFTIERDNRVRQAKVTTGRRVGERIEIVSGLAADARVVASGVGFLADGDLVRVVSGSAGNGAAASPSVAAKPVAKS